MSLVAERGPIACDYPGKIGVSRGMRLRRVFLQIRWNHSDSSVQSEDRDLSRHVIDVACAVRTSSRWRRFSMDQSQISKMLASPRIVDDRARSGGDLRRSAREWLAKLELGNDQLVMHIADV